MIPPTDVLQFEDGTMTASVVARSQQQHHQLTVPATAANATATATDERKRKPEDEIRSKIVPSGMTFQAPLRQPKLVVKLLEKSVIIHRDENGFGLCIRGQAPMSVEHVHAGGAAWRAGVRQKDTISKVNGIPICNMDHKSVVLMLKSCAHFVALTLLCPISSTASGDRFSTTLKETNSTLMGESLSQKLSSDCQRYYPLSAPHLMRTSDRGQVSTLNGRRGATRPQSNRKYSSSEERNNEDEHGGDCDDESENGALEGSASAKGDGGERLAVCICCRSLLDTGQPRGRAGGATCAQCQQKLQLQQARAKFPLHMHHQKSALLQQHGGSLREQPQAPNEMGKQQHHQRLATFSSTNSSPKAHQQPLGQRKFNKRLEILREFLDTERAHTERLRCIDELFYRPLKSGALMTSEQLKAVFSCHRTLYKIHRQIYRILLSATTVGASETLSGGSGACAQGEQLCGARSLPATSLFATDPLIGSALMEIFGEGDLRRQLERAACSFCSAQATNVELLNRLTRRDTKVGEFLAQVTSQRIVLGRLGIKDLLASCFQRLTKYPLLLENLLKATPSEAPPEVEDDQSLFATLERDSCTFDEDSMARWPSGEEGRDQHSIVIERQQQRRRNSRRMLAISLAEERDLIERSLQQSRQILVKVNESIKVALARQKFKEIWRKTDKYPGVLPPSLDITKQQVIHEGALTLRLSKRSFDVYMVLLNDYIIILTRDGREDKFRLKYFTPEGKVVLSSVVGPAAAPPPATSVSLSGSSSISSSQASGFPSNSPAGSTNANTAAGQAASSSAGPQSSSNAAAFNSMIALGASNITANNQAIYSPIFIIDEHLTTRDAATDENGFYLLCKRRDDSRIYEFASRSPAERIKWRELIQWTVERQINRDQRRASCASTITKSSFASSVDSSGTITSEQQPKQPASTRRRTGSGPSSRMQECESDGASSGATGLLARGKNRKSLVGSMSSGETSSSNKTAITEKGRQQLCVNTTTTSASNRPGSVAGGSSRPSTPTTGEPTKIVGTISYVIDDEIVMPSKMESSRIFVDQAIQVNILDGIITTTRTAGLTPSKQ